MLSFASSILSILVICICSTNLTRATPLDASPTAGTTLNLGMSMFELQPARTSNQVQTTQLIFASKSASALQTAALSLASNDAISFRVSSDPSSMPSSLIHAHAAASSTTPSQLVSMAAASPSNGTTMTSGARPRQGWQGWQGWQGLSGLFAIGLGMLAVA